MRKFLYVLLIFIIVLALASLFFLDLNKNEEKDSSLEKITVAGAAHTIFYAPQYVAISQGFFEEEGLEIELLLTPGADKVSAAVLSGDVQIGFSGSEACI